MKNIKQLEDKFVEIKKFFKERKCILLSKEYNGNKYLLEYKCSEGHIQKARWNDLVSEKRSLCKVCNKKDAKYHRLPKEEVRKEFEKYGYKQLSEYIRASEKVLVECPNEHKFRVTWNNFKYNKSRCPICSLKKRVAKRTFEYDYVKLFFEKENYQLISDSYKNCDTSLNVICPKGHEWSVSFKEFKKGARCRYCYNKYKRGIKLRLDFEIVKKVFEKRDYTLISTKKDYKSVESKLNYICPNGHKGSMSYHNFSVGNDCPKCYHPSSKAEQEIADLLKIYFPDLLQNDRLIIKPQELDIVIPNKKIAIEYCGLYWHSELNGKSRSYHLNKLKNCNKAGYNLITIFEDEWLFNKEITKSRLKTILGISDSKRIFARKCTIKEIDAKTKNEFLERNHLQGKDLSNIKLGAFYNNKLVSIMTFSKGSIAKGSTPKEDVWELNRFCSDRDYSIVGIASKLFKHFTQNYNPVEIYSYSDKRWSTGYLYEILGFSKSHDSDPNYWYLSFNRRIHRFNFRKGVLSKKLKEFDDNISEWQNMIKNGYNRIWDCGNTKWIIDFM